MANTLNMRYANLQLLTVTSVFW